jgi:hypothetical protein
VYTKAAFLMLSELGEKLPGRDLSRGSIIKLPRKHSLEDNYLSLSDASWMCSVEPTRVAWKSSVSCSGLGGVVSIIGFKIDYC